MVIKGQAGIGKTTLWRSSDQSEREQRHHGPVGALRRGRVAARPRRPPRPARRRASRGHRQDGGPRALGACGCDRARSPRGGTTRRLALSRCVSRVLRALARDRPVLVAVDDVQWLDTSSARVISFAGRRLGDPGRDAPHATGRDQRSPGYSGRVRRGLRGAAPRPLEHGCASASSSHAPRIRIPRPSWPESTTHPVGIRCSRSSSRGRSANVTDRARASADTGVVARARTRAPRATVARRPASAAIVGACGQPTLSLLATVDPAAGASLDAAVDDGVLTIGTDETVGFTHPLLASAAYADLPLSQRRTVHAKVAPALQRPRGARAASRPRPVKHPRLRPQRRSTTRLRAPTHAGRLKRQPNWRRRRFD